MFKKSMLAATAATVLFMTPARAPAASFVYNATLVGKSETFTGQHFPYKGSGTMTIDDVAGTVSYSFLLTNGLTFAGTGQAAITPKGRVFGLVTSSSGGINGTAIVEGSTPKNRKTFTVKITAAIPNRLGPAPQGFVLSKITAKGKQQ
jgi:hypothetical protein